MTEKPELKPSFLVVDDEPAVGRLLKRALAPLSDDIVVVESAAEALQVCLGRSFDLVISDMRMPEMNGVELVRILSKDYPSMRRIILTGYADLGQTMKSINEGKVNRYLTKPFVISSLIQEVSDELRLGKRERSEVTRLRKAIDKLSKE